MKLERFEHLVVHGSLSQGKRWIVMDALCSYLVMRQTGGVVFWINCGKCKCSKSILELLEKLYILSQPYHHVTLAPSNYNDINNKILSYTQAFQRIFDKGDLKDCLIVLIDVQNCDTLKAFDINCKRLITTRNKKVIHI